ncbi:MAG: hypothetical protein IKD93_03355 [Firmicutes bacterium]|nr:hypothetical protein [Bacillota bacterium]
MKHPAYPGIRRGVRRLAAVLLVLALALTGAACARRSGSQVAGARQQVIYGYLLEVNDRARTVTVDPVELVKGTDSQRLARLGAALTEGGRSYAYNARRNFVMYPLDPAAGFDFGGGNAAGNGPDGAAGGERRGETGGHDAANSGGSSANGDSGAANNGGNTTGSYGAADNGPLAANDQGADNRSGADNNSDSNTAGGYGAADNGPLAANDQGADNNGGDTAGGGDRKGYGYAQVEGGLFSAFGSDLDRINAYLDRYGDLLCRLTLEDGSVTQITVCTADNM